MHRLLAPVLVLLPALAAAGPEAAATVTAEAPASPRPLALESSLPGGAVAVGAWAGPSCATCGNLSLRIDPTLAAGISDRVTVGILPAPAVAVRLGEARGAEGLITAGLGGLFGAFTGEATVRLFPWMGGVLRRPAAEGVDLLAGVELGSAIDGSRGGRSFAAWFPAGWAGAMLRLGDRVTLTPGVAVRTLATLDDDDHVVRAEGFAVALGSAAELGTGRVPLLRFHLDDRFSLDLVGSVAWHRPVDRVSSTALAGFTWVP